MLDLYKLQLFMAVAQDGSFSAAADRFYITQSAVSQHVKDLEVSLGQKLFERGRRGVTLTPRGETLYTYGREIAALVARAENAVTDVAHLAEGRVSLGVTPGIAVYLAPSWTLRFRAAYPRLTVAMQTGVTGEIVPEILAAHLEFGLIEGELEAYQQPRLAWRDLEEIEQFIVVGPNHPWAEREELSLAELNRQPFIMRQAGSQSRAWLEGTLRPQGVVPLVATENDNLEAIKRSAAQGSCLAVLPRYVMEPEVAAGMLRAIPVAGRPLRRTLKLVWAADSYFTPIARAYLAALTADYPAIASVAAAETV
jgi:DNA-binding transcriptional LysR family regulator